MAHSKVSMLSDMSTQGIEIMDTLVREGVSIKPEHLNVPDGSEDLRADFIRPAYHWVADLYESEYTEITRIKAMQPDEIWSRYKLWGGFEDHREVVLLKEALNALRTKLVSRKRPDFYKKSTREKAFKAARLSTVKSGHGSD